jgi:hypothetical protein
MAMLAGEARDVSDGNGLHSFQVRDDNLPVQRSELQDDLLNLIQRLIPIQVPRLLLHARQGSLDFLETGQLRVDAPLPDDVRGGRVVGYAEGPGLE